MSWLWQPAVSEVVAAGVAVRTHAVGCAGSAEPVRGGTTRSCHVSAAEAVAVADAVVIAAAES